MHNSIIGRALVTSALALTAATAAAQDSSATRLNLGTAQSIAGYAHFDLGDLDARLTAAGLPRVASGAATIGLGADVRRGRMLLGASYQSLLARNTMNAAYRTRISGGYGLMDVGYAIVRTGRTSVYPIAGLGVTSLSVNVRERGDFVFDDGLHEPGRQLSLSGVSAVAHAGMLIEQRFQRGNGSEFGVSLRYGITSALGSQAWRSEENHVSGGPGGARGSYVRLSFSKGLKSRRDGLVPIAAAALQSVLR